MKNGVLGHSYSLEMRKSETENCVSGNCNIECTEHDVFGFNRNGESFAMTQLADPESSQFDSGSDPSFPVAAPCTKLRKLCSDRSEPRLYVIILVYFTFYFSVLFLILSFGI